MKILQRLSFVQVIGRIWQPGVTAAMTYDLRPYDVENMRDDDGKITRDSMEDWLGSHAGDFQEVTDFRASIEDGETTIDIDWAKEESELTFNDCMFPEV
jgi:hypothetical protein